MTYLVLSCYSLKISPPGFAKDQFVTELDTVLDAQKQV